MTQSGHLQMRPECNELRPLCRRAGFQAELTCALELTDHLGNGDLSYPLVCWRAGEAQLGSTMMKITSVYTFLAIMVAGVTLAYPSNATTIQYTLSAADGSGDTFGGTFDFDTITFADTNIALTASGPNTFSETLSTLVFASPLGTELVASNTVDGSSITLNFSPSLATFPPDLDLLVVLFNSEYLNGQSPYIPYILSGDVVGTTVTSTPLPSTFPLFAIGLGGLGLLGWRRKRKAQLAA
jgi:PEP-CTERM motif